MARRLRVTLLAACITWGTFLIASDLIGIPSKDASELELSREIPPSTLAEGFKMPELSLETLELSGVKVRRTTEALARGRALVLFFLPPPECLPCLGLLLNIAERVTAHPQVDQVEYAFVTKADTPALRTLIADLRQIFSGAPPEGFRFWLDPELKLARLFRVYRVPTIFLLHEGRPIRRLDWPWASDIDRALQELDEQLQALLQGSLAEPSPLLAKVNSPAPPFVARTVEGDEITLETITKPAILGFLSFEDCLSPKMIAGLTEASLTMGIAVYVIALDDPRVVQAAVETQGVAFPVILDPDLDIAQAFGVPGLPTTVLLDQEGVVRWVQVGYREDFTKVLQIVLQPLRRSWN